MNTLEIAEIVGTIAFALSGFMIATKDRLDLLGIVISSFLTALGGGIIRDTVAGLKPYAFSHYLPTILVLVVITVSVIFKLYRIDRIVNNSYFLVSDSIGLISFSITGALVGIIAGFNIFGVILLSFVTAVGGGILRDTLLNKVPVVLTSELYGTISILIAIIVYLLNKFNLQSEISILILFIFGLSFRIIAYKHKWHLPKLHRE